MPVRAVDGRDVEAVAREVGEASLVATAVGARALGAIARPIAQGLERRWQIPEARPLNIIICENLRTPQSGCEASYTMLWRPSHASHCPSM